MTDDTDTFCDTKDIYFTRCRSCGAKFEDDEVDSAIDECPYCCEH